MVHYFPTTWIIALLFLWPQGWLCELRGFWTFSDPEISPSHSQQNHGLLTVKCLIFLINNMSNICCDIIISHHQHHIIVLNECWLSFSLTVLSFVMFWIHPLAKECYNSGFMLQRGNKLTDDFFLYIMCVLYLLHVYIITCICNYIKS